MANTIDIRRRIRSVKNTQQITKAMKMVSAAKLRRAQERMFAARPYAAALRQVLSSVATRVEELKHPLLETREEKKTLDDALKADLKKTLDDFKKTFVSSRQAVAVGA